LQDLRLLRSGKNFAFLKDSLVGDNDMEKPCSFCEKAQPRTLNLALKPWDVILFQSKNFIVFPTMGGMLEGWLLVVPRRHYICMAAMEKNLWSELQELRELVSIAIEECYGPIAAFEHGPTKPDQPVGCGVDHAHLHLVPTRCDLSKGLEGFLSESVSWNAIGGIHDLKKIHESAKLPYLYLEQPLGCPSVATHSKFESQLFRRVLARHLDRGASYDWRQFPEEINAYATVCKIAEWHEATTNLRV
jgi:ATP adenylyltransferase